jgi:hypothetical protein
MDSAAVIVRDASRPLFDADEGRPELQAGLSGRTGLPSAGDRSITVAVVACVTVVEGEITLMLGPGDHSCQRWRLSEGLADKLEFELATARMRRR